MKHNLIANIAGTACTGLVTLALVPLYVRFLGTEGYGLIGFYASIMVIVALLDFGLGITVNREFARRSPDQTGVEAWAMLRTAEWIYTAIAVLVGTTLFAAAPWISSHWFSRRALSGDLITAVLQAMSVAVAFRFLYGLYASALLGAMHHVTLNAIAIGTAIVRGCTAIVLLIFFAADLRMLMLAEIPIAALQTIAAAVAMYRSKSRVARIPHLDFASLRKAWSFGIVVAVIGVLSGLVSQVDRLVVSRVLPLSVFGAYTVAVTIGAIVSMVVAPVHATLFPRFTQLFVRRESEELARVYHRGTQVIAAMMFPVAIVAAMFPEEIVGLWIGSRALAAEMRWTVTFLVIGSAFYALTTLLYALQLASGWLTPTVLLNGVALATLIPASIWSASRYGAAGPAATWLIVNAAVLLIDGLATHARLLPGHLFRWLARDLAPSAVVVLVVSVVARMTWNAVQPVEPLAIAAMLAATGLVALAAAAYTADAVRDHLHRR
jgi:O-antigen/teichoic acid export membrane protein